MSSPAQIVLYFLLSVLVIVTIVLGGKRIRRRAIACCHFVFCAKAESVRNANLLDS